MVRRKARVTSEIVVVNVGKAKIEADVSYEVLEKVKDIFETVQNYNSIPQT